MPRNITVTFGDGTTHTYQNAPDDVTPDSVQARAEKEFSKSVVSLDGGRGKPGEGMPGQRAKPSLASEIGQQVGNVVAGGLRGAGSIGATLIRPFESAQENEDRRKAMDAALASMGAQPESLAYKGAKLGTEVAGTSGTGGLIAKGLGFIPGVAKVAPNLLSAIQSGGFSAGQATGANALAARMAGGALTGYASAGLVSPKDAKTGALIGGALPMAGALIKSGVQAGKNALGLSTGVGTRPLEEAYKAGKAGGETADTFLKNMRGQAQMDDVLTAAKDNLAAMNAAKQAEYRSGMIDIKNDKSILDFSGVDNAIKKSMDMVSFKGQVKNTKAAESVQKINDEVQAWKNLNPAEYHTPEGLDALKQKIGSMIEDIPFEQKSTRKAAGEIYSALKNEISTQAPTYDKVMKDYSQASDTIKEIERTLSLNPKASADTAMRKLQSLMRNNVSTNYGQRLNLAQELEQAGGNELMPALAGQALNEWAPRGIQRAAAMPGGLAAFSLGGLPAAAATAAFSSPRLMGETAYKAGKISNALSSQQINALNQLLYRSAPLAGTK